MSGYWQIGSENLQELFETTTMYFDTKERVLDALDIDPSTYRDYLNAERDTILQRNGREMLEIVNQDPEYSFDDDPRSEIYVKVPEEEAWGSNRVRLQDGFRQFLFGRQLFGPFEEPELKDLCGISRQAYMNYRKEDRSIPVDVYEPLFEFYRNVYSWEFDMPDSCDPETRFDLELNGSRERLSRHEGFDDARELILEELEDGMDMTRPRNQGMEEIFEEFEDEGIVRKIGKPGRLYRITV